MRHYLWRAVDHAGEVLESYVTKRPDWVAALKFIKKAMKRYGRPDADVTDKLRSYGAAFYSVQHNMRLLSRGIISRITEMSGDGCTTKNWLKIAAVAQRAWGDEKTFLQRPVSR